MSARVHCRFCYKRMKTGQGFCTRCGKSATGSVSDDGASKAFSDAMVVKHAPGQRSGPVDWREYMYDADPEIRQFAFDQIHHKEAS